MPRNGRCPPRWMTHRAHERNPLVRRSSCHENGRKDYAEIPPKSYAVDAETSSRVLSQKKGGFHLPEKHSKGHKPSGFGDPPAGQANGGGARTRDRRLPSDLKRTFYSPCHQ
ncbi:hypothetical protein PoB_007520800 [Plakobranchus ocellatus]|uniref:Uncharacterized protein n=1 Tax=Plakobranchus ocellatus TaxID=259542 RepID=A0AAV4DWE2_9GAST|nr:hypothetical protein PoB_007520800 [Plakobranchus ocellatus]